MTRILLVEDEQHIAQGIRFNLEAEGYGVDVCAEGEEALARLLGQTTVYDLVLLDVMLPGRDGFEVAAALRNAERFVPVLMLTAHGRPEDVLKGFEAGADDYLVKPFELKILLARVKGLLRRVAWTRENLQPPAPVAPPDVLTFGGKTLDLRALQLRVGDRAFHLTVMECDLLHYLVKNAGKAVSRRSILEDVWDLHEDTDTRAIDNFVVRLRRYIEANPSEPRHLLTVRGVGYRFVTEPE
jgi:DNA-binding response OmpR family regulator